MALCWLLFLCVMSAVNLQNKLELWNLVDRQEGKCKRKIQTILDKMCLYEEDGFLRLISVNLRYCRIINELSLALAPLSSDHCFCERKTSIYRENKEVLNLKRKIIIIFSFSTRLMAVVDSNSELYKARQSRFSILILSLRSIVHVAHSSRVSQVPKNFLNQFLCKTWLTQG